MKAVTKDKMAYWIARNLPRRVLHWAILWAAVMHGGPQVFTRQGRRNITMQTLLDAVARSPRRPSRAQRKALQK